MVKEELVRHNSLTPPQFHLEGKQENKYLKLMDFSSFEEF